MTLRNNFGRKQDTFGHMLQEMQQEFSTRYNTNIIGRDIESVLTNPVLFESYVSTLSEGFEATVGEELRSLLESARNEILSENSLTGIQPFHSLAMPMLVKLWARLSMTEAIPTEPTKTPTFTVPFARPYMLDADGNKTYLPESINHAGNNGLNLRPLKKEVTLTSGKATNYDLATGLTSFKAGLDTLDRRFSVEKVFYPDAKPEGVELVGSQAAVLDGNGNIYVAVKYPDSTAPTTIHEDVLIGHVDLEKAKLTLVSTSGTATKVEILGHVSSEAHTASVQVSVEIERRDITIGTAQHIEGSMPLEMLQDVSAMYDIDGAAMITEHMTAVTAQKVDLDIIAFLEKAYAGTKAQYTKQFNVVPSSTYQMHPNDWLKGLQKTIDFVATSMRNDHKIYDAYFVIVGNPLDTALLPNVDWTFTQGLDQVNGIDVTYSIGAINGSTQYKIISSDLVAQGDLTIFAVPTRDSYKTFVYYPYTFSVVQNYLNARNERIPSIMMTRRYTIEEFTPIIGKVKITGNDGTVYARA